MEFGIFSESGVRGHAVAAQSYAEDLQEIVTADRLGFCEAWIAERASRSDRRTRDILSAANVFIGAAGALTTQIRLGTGIRPLAYYRPYVVATEAAVCDHMTGGRFMLGYGGTHGIENGDHHVQIGIPGEDQRAMVYEAVDYIMKCFTCPEPFDFDGQFWHGRNIQILPRPLQQPHPPLAAACSGAVETIDLAARSGFIPLFGRGLESPSTIREWGDAYVKLAKEAGRPPSRRQFRVVRHVYVSSTRQGAREELRAGMVAWIERRRSINDLSGIMRWMEPGQTGDAYFDYLLDAGYIFVGDPDGVCEAIRDYYDESGGFGVLLVFAAQGYVSQEGWERSLGLIAEQVAPRLSQLDPDASG